MVQGDRPSSFVWSVLAAVVAYVACAFQVYSVLNVCLIAIRIWGGLTSFAFLFGLVVLSVATLVFALIVPPYYRKAIRKDRVAGYFLRMSAIQAGLFPVLRVFTYLAIPIARPVLSDYLIDCAGLAVAVVCAVLAHRLFSKKARGPVVSRATPSSSTPG